MRKPSKIVTRAALARISRRRSRRWRALADPVSPASAQRRPASSREARGAIAAETPVEARAAPTPPFTARASPGSCG